MLLFKPLPCANHATATSHRSSRRGGVHLVDAFASPSYSSRGLTFYVENGDVPQSVMVDWSDFASRKSPKGDQTAHEYEVNCGVPSLCSRPLDST